MYKHVLTLAIKNEGLRGRELDGLLVLRKMRA